MYSLMSNVIRFVWLIALSALCGLSALGTSPTCVSRGAAFCSFKYDATAKLCYDRSLFLTFGYDRSPTRNTNRCAGQSAGAGAIFGQFAKFLAAEGGAFSAIGSTGKVGEQWLAENIGGESQAYFSTSQGARYVDQLADEIAYESKVGYQSLTPSIQLQISKDAELINTGVIQGSEWHFFTSPVTGVGGPSQPLLNALQQNGIGVVIHP
jgi:hypothetical protein